MLVVDGIRFMLLGFRQTSYVVVDGHAGHFGDKKVGLLAKKARQN